MRKNKDTLSTIEKIAMCGIVLMGRDVLPEAYAMSHPRTKTTSENSLNVMQSRWYASPLAKKFREEIYDKLSRIANEQGADLTTREGIVKQLISATHQTSGKDSVSALQTLAKIQGLDKPQDDQTESEKRTYFLPWVSNCRNCELMKLYMKVQKEKNTNCMTDENESTSY